MPGKPIIQSKTCSECGKIFHRGRKENSHNWKIHEYCGPACRRVVEHRRRKELKLKRPKPEISWPRGRFSVNAKLDVLLCKPWTKA